MASTKTPQLDIDLRDPSGGDLSPGGNATRENLRKAASGVEKSEQLSEDLKEKHEEIENANLDKPLQTNSTTVTKTGTATQNRSRDESAKHEQLGSGTVRKRGKRKRFGAMRNELLEMEEVDQIVSCIEEALDDQAAGSALERSSGDIQSALSELSQQIKNALAVAEQQAPEGERAIEQEVYKDEFTDSLGKFWVENDLVQDKSELEEIASLVKKEKSGVLLKREERNKAIHNLVYKNLPGGEFDHVAIGDALFKKLSRELEISLSKEESDALRVSMKEEVKEIALARAAVRFEAQYELLHELLEEQLIRVIRESEDKTLLGDFLSGMIELDELFRNTEELKAKYPAFFDRENETSKLFELKRAEKNLHFSLRKNLKDSFGFEDLKELKDDSFGDRDLLAEKDSNREERAALKEIREILRGHPAHCVIGKDEDLLKRYTNHFDRIIAFDMVLANLAGGRDAGRIRSSNLPKIEQDLITESLKARASIHRKEAASSIEKTTEARSNLPKGKLGDDLVAGLSATFSKEKAQEKIEVPLERELPLVDQIVEDLNVEFEKILEDKESTFKELKAHYERAKSERYQRLSEGGKVAVSERVERAFEVSVISFYERYLRSDLRQEEVDQDLESFVSLELSAEKGELFTHPITRRAIENTLERKSALDNWIASHNVERDSLVQEREEVVQRLKDKGLLFNQTSSEHRTNYLVTRDMEIKEVVMTLWDLPPDASPRLYQIYLEHFLMENPDLLKEVQENSDIDPGALIIEEGREVNGVGSVQDTTLNLKYLKILAIDTERAIGFKGIESELNREEREEGEKLLSLIESQRRGKEEREKANSALQILGELEQNFPELRAGMTVESEAIEERFKDVEKLLVELKDGDRDTTIISQIERYRGDLKLHYLRHQGEVCIGRGEDERARIKIREALRDVRRDLQELSSDSEREKLHLTKEEISLLLMEAKSYLSGDEVQELLEKGGGELDPFDNRVRERREEQYALYKIIRERRDSLSEDLSEEEFDRFSKVIEREISGIETEYARFDKTQRSFSVIADRALALLNSKELSGVPIVSSLSYGSARVVLDDDTGEQIEGFLDAALDRHKLMTLSSREMEKILKRYDALSLEERDEFFQIIEAAAIESLGEFPEKDNYRYRGDQYTLMNLFRTIAEKRGDGVSSARAHLLTAKYKLVGEEKQPENGLEDLKRAEIEIKRNRNRFQHENQALLDSLQAEYQSSTSLTEQRRLAQEIVTLQRTVASYTQLLQQSRMARYEFSLKLEDLNGAAEVRREFEGEATLFKSGGEEIEKVNEEIARLEAISPDERDALRYSSLIAQRDLLLHASEAQERFAANLLLQEAIAAVNLNESDIAEERMASFKRNYGDREWAKRSITLFDEEDRRGNLEAFAKVMMSELNSEGMVEALAWQGGGAAVGAAIGGTIGAYGGTIFIPFVGTAVGWGAGMVVGGTVGWAFGTATLKAKNLAFGWRNIYNAGRTGITDISNFQFGMDTVAFGLDAIDIVAPGVGKVATVRKMASESMERAIREETEVLLRAKAEDFITKHTKKLTKEHGEKIAKELAEKEWKEAGELGEKYWKERLGREVTKRKHYQSWAFESGQFGARAGGKIALGYLGLAVAAPYYYGWDKEKSFTENLKHIGLEHTLTDVTQIGTHMALVWAGGKVLQRVGEGYNRRIKKLRESFKSKDKKKVSSSLDDMTATTKNQIERAKDLHEVSRTPEGEAARTTDVVDALMGDEPTLIREAPQKKSADADTRIKELEDQIFKGELEGGELQSAQIELRNLKEQKILQQEMDKAEGLIAENESLMKGKYRNNEAVKREISEAIDKLYDKLFDLRDKIRGLEVKEVSKKTDYVDSEVKSDDADYDHGESWKHEQYEPRYEPDADEGGGGFYGDDGDAPKFDGDSGGGGGTAVAPKQKVETKRKKRTRSPETDVEVKREVESKPKGDETRAKTKKVEEVATVKTIEPLKIEPLEVQPLKLPVEVPQLKPAPAPVKHLNEVPELTRQHLARRAAAIQNYEALDLQKREQIKPLEELALQVKPEVHPHLRLETAQKKKVEEENKKKLKRAQFEEEGRGRRKAYGSRFNPSDVPELSFSKFQWELDPLHSKFAINLLFRKEIIEDVLSFLDLLHEEEWKSSERSGGAKVRKWTEALY